MMKFDDRQHRGRDSQARLADLLCQRVSRGECLDADDFARLAECSPEALAELFEQVQMHCELEEHLGGIPSSAQAIKQRLKAAHSEGQVEPQAVVRLQPLDLAQQALMARFKSEHQRLRKLALLLAASLVALFVMTFLFIFDKGPKDLAQQASRFGSADSPIEVVKSPRYGSDPEEAILLSYAPELAASGEWLRAEFGLSQSEIILRKGWCEFALRGGGVVRMVAPSTVRVVDETHVFLEQGSLSAGTTAPSGQITVLTQGAAIVDTGTAFAVKQNEGAHPSVYVYEGQVQVALNAEAPDQAPIQLTLNQGESYAVADPSTTFPAPPNLVPTGFWDTKRSIQVRNTASLTGEGMVHQITGFDLKGSSKLVVTAGTEPSGGVPFQLAIESITFAGEALTEVFSYVEAHRQITAYSIDQPKAAVGDIVIRYQDRFTTGIGAFAILGAAEGVAEYSVQSGYTSAPVTTSKGDLMIGCLGTNGSSRLIQPEAGSNALFSANILDPGGCNVASVYSFSDTEGTARMSFSEGGPGPMIGVLVLSPATE
jgi:hypothetical protein